MSGTPVSGPSRPHPVSARARLRPKSQLTLPEEIRRALRVDEGDEVEFSIGENSVVTVRGYVSVPTDQAWFFAVQPGDPLPASERNVGRAVIHESAGALFTYLDSLGAADA